LIVQTGLPGPAYYTPARGRAAVVVPHFIREGGRRDAGFGVRRIDIDLSVDVDRGSLRGRVEHSRDEQPVTISGEHRRRARGERAVAVHAQLVRGVQVQHVPAAVPPSTNRAVGARLPASPGRDGEAAGDVQRCVAGCRAVYRTGRGRAEELHGCAEFPALPR